jgi:hypothetical protein
MVNLCITSNGFPDSRKMAFHICDVLGGVDVIVRGGVGDEEDDADERYHAHLHPVLHVQHIPNQNKGDGLPKDQPAIPLVNFYREESGQVEDECSSYELKACNESCFVYSNKSAVFFPGKSGSQFVYK